MFVLYRPPPSTQNGFKTATFFKEFSEFISEHVTTTAEIIIVGDLNLHLDITQTLTLVNLQTFWHVVV